MLGASPEQPPQRLMNDWSLYSMFLLGLLGTGHCLGMCGPLVLALPAQRGRLTAHLLYHLGRISTYTIVGALLGVAGASVAELGTAAPAGQLGAMAQVQVGLSLVAAALLLLFGLVRLGILREPSWMALASPSRIPGFRRLQQVVASGRGGLALFAFGLLLGLLPCGLSFAAFAAALPAGGAGGGALRLLAFGIGTLPGLLLLGTVASRFARRHARLFDVLAGLLLVGMAVSLAVDGLSAIAS